jgi:very-short-patch-repair endonuclease
MNYKEQFQGLKSRQTCAQERIIAFSMQKNPSECEAIVYDAMSEAGIQFKPQEIVGPYIVDILINFRHVIEIDGRTHDNRKAYDLARDQFLWRRGYKVLRVTNREVKADIKSVIVRIREFANQPI